MIFGRFIVRRIAVLRVHDMGYSNARHCGEK
jgi:hypothetical protein